MSQSLTQIYLHLVFSTKLRNPYLADDGFRQRMFEYAGKTCGELGSPVLKVGGTEDHIHILCRLGKVIAVADLVRDLKRATSRWAKETQGGVPNFAWQAGYGGFSVSPGHVEALTEYIANQWKHHHPNEAAGETYQDEFRRLCATYGLEIDERYCWD
jgi:putative transposase